jgi:uncharacterized protein
MWRILIILSLILGSGRLSAVEVTGLYEAEVIVADQSREVLNAAMTSGFTEVIVRVSGYSGVINEPAIRQAIARPAPFVQQFRYISENVTSESGLLTSQLRLYLLFDSLQIDNLLRRNALPIWGAMRPALLLWLVVEEGSTRQLVGSDDRGAAIEIMQQRARQRGLPLRLPLMDLTDQSIVTAADVWAGFLDRIREASQRYRPEAILVGRVWLEAGVWQGDWTLLQSEGEQRWRKKDAEAMQVLFSGVDSATDTLSREFARQFYSANDQFQIVVVNIHSLVAWQRLKDYLHGLHGMSRVQIDRLSHNRMLLSIEMAGGQGALDRLVKLGRTLRALPPPTAPTVELLSTTINEAQPQIPHYQLLQ